MTTLEYLICALGILAILISIIDMIITIKLVKKKNKHIKELEDRYYKLKYGEKRS